MVKVGTKKKRSKQQLEQVKAEELELKKIRHLMRVYHVPFIEQTWFPIGGVALETASSWW